MKLTSISNLKFKIQNSKLFLYCLLLSMLCVLSFSGCGGGGASNTTTTTNTSNNGSLYVETTYPPSATVYLNGENKGTTPLSLTIPAGSYTLKVSMNLYQDKEQTIVIEVNKTTLVSVTLDQDTSSLTLPPF